MIKEIIESLAEGKQPIADVLRRMLVLSYRINHEALRNWINQELKGYPRDAELPGYRQAIGASKGFFVGFGGGTITNQPLTASVLKPEHRHWARKIQLRQPIASYDMPDEKKTTNLAIEWPADLVVHYQTKFFEDWILNRAWQEIPASVVIGLIDTVRTRLLTFALEIDAATSTDGEQALAQIPPATIDRIMHVTIMGGNNVIGSVNEFKAATVVAGDMGSLREKLLSLGLDTSELESLESVLGEEGLLAVNKDQPTTPGQKTLDWIAGAAKTTGKKGLEVGGAVVQEAIKRAVFGYLGY